MANQLYGQRGFSSIYTTTTTTPSRSAIDSTSLLSSSRYLPAFSEPYSLSSDPSPPALFSTSDRTPSTFGDSFRFSTDNPGYAVAASSRSMAGAGAATATSTALWPAFDVSSTLAKRPSEALYDKSIVGAHLFGQSEAWLASDSLAKRPRIGNASHLPIYPQRPGEKDCAHYMLTRTCKFGENCKFDHPVWVPMGGIPDWKELPSSVPPEFHPERSAEPDCPYFLKTQKCKFGLNCKFNHPKDKLGTSGGALDLPERPSEPLCSFYMKTGNCKFGAACKFHHPKDIQIPSSGQAGNAEQANSVANVSTNSDVNAIKTFTTSSATLYNSKGLPIRVGEMDCPFYMKTGSCKYGANCRYNHPDRTEFYSPFSIVNAPAAAIGHSLASPVASLNVDLVNPAASILQTLAQTTLGLGHPAVYPQRPGQIECDYYMKTGECKFGERCKFHHPVDRSAPKLTPAGLPRREGVLHCPYYMKTGTCSYGVSCRFDHPPPGEVLALAAKETSASTIEEGKKHGENVDVEKEEKGES